MTNEWLLLWSLSTSTVSFEISSNAGFFVVIKNRTSLEEHSTTGKKTGTWLTITEDAMDKHTDKRYETWNFPTTTPDNRTRKKLLTIALKVDIQFMKKKTYLLIHQRTTPTVIRRCHWPRTDRGPGSNMYGMVGQRAEIQTCKRGIQDKNVQEIRINIVHRVQSTNKNRQIATWKVSNSRRPSIQLESDDFSKPRRRKDSYSRCQCGLTYGQQLIVMSFIRRKLPPKWSTTPDHLSP